MGLLPEFFILLGINIFLAMSLLTALLDDEMPSTAQYLFQGAALLGLGPLLISQSLVNSGVLTKDPADQIRFLISVVYLSSAIFAVLGLNAYLGIISRKIALATTFAGTVTVPITMVSAFLVTLFLSTGGNVTATFGNISIFVIAAIVTGMSIAGFLRQAAKHTDASQVGTSEPKLPPLPDMSVSTPEEALTPLSPPPGFLSLHLPSMQGETWEESPTKKEREA